MFPRVLGYKRSGIKKVDIREFRAYLERIFKQLCGDLGACLIERCMPTSLCPLKVSPPFALRQ